MKIWLKNSFRQTNNCVRFWELPAWKKALANGIGAIFWSVFAFDRHRRHRWNCRCHCSNHSRNLLEVHTTRNIYAFAIFGFKLYQFKQTHKHTSTRKYFYFALWPPLLSAQDLNAYLSLSLSISLIATMTTTKDIEGECIYFHFSLFIFTLFAFIL